ncbi:MAG: hypothetical protein WAN35_12775 [Terracidiphilus sp.]
MKIVILGPDGAGKSSVIHGLMKNLHPKGRAVKVRHLKHRIAFPDQGDASGVVEDPHGKPPRSLLISVGKVLLWLAEEWYGTLFLDKRRDLLIYDRYYHDLLIDSKRYRYGGPRWLAVVIGLLVPRPRLWLLLDAPSKVLQARKREVSPEESERQRQAYLDFVRKQQNHVVIHAEQSLNKVVADTEKAITGALREDEGHSV